MAIPQLSNLRTIAALGEMSLFHYIAHVPLFFFRSSRTFLRLSEDFDSSKFFLQSISLVFLTLWDIVVEICTVMLPGGASDVPL